jgi:arsenate reductase (thioredoxin)
MSLLVASITVLAAALGADQSAPLDAAIREYVAARAGECDQIPEERRQQLAEIAAYVRQRASSGQPALLTFICTHNSRRSHLAQIWAQVAAGYYGVGGVQTFSGGTEATAFNRRAIGALERAGFSITSTDADSTKNPRYYVHFQDSAPPLVCFSKVFNEAPNPQQGYCAIMTCSQADQACPIVPGAAHRVALPYEDPKAFDDSAQEAEKYDERCRQIAREMLFVFSLLKR